MSIEQETLFWCVPDADDAARFQSVIDDLASRQKAPWFQPHLTLGAVRGAEPDIHPVLDAMSEFELSPIEIGETSTFTMSLFVRFAASDALLAGRNAMEGLPGFRPGRDFDPHMSLCYGDPVDRAEFDADIAALLERPVKFDRLVAMRIPIPVETYDDIRAWEELGSYPIEE